MPAMTAMRSWLRVPGDGDPGPDGCCREHTVATPGSDDRGAWRIVAGDGGEFYWTDDHYASFTRIER